MPSQPPVVDTMADRYFEPAWTAVATQSAPNVPGQIAASLLRHRRAGVPFALAFKSALRTIRWPHDRAEHHQWLALFADEAWVDAVWGRAYRREPSIGGDYSALHHALEERDQATAPTHRQRRAPGLVKALGEAA